MIDIIGIYTFILQSFLWNEKTKSTNWLKFNHLAKFCYWFYTTKKRAESGNNLIKFSFKSYQRFFPEANYDVFRYLLKLFTKLNDSIDDKYFKFYKVDGHWKYIIEIHPNLACIHPRITKYEGKATKETCDSIEMRARVNHRGSAMKLQKFIEKVKKDSETLIEKTPPNSEESPHTLINLNGNSLDISKYTCNKSASPLKQEIFLKNDKEKLNYLENTKKRIEWNSENDRILRKKLKKKGLTHENLEYIFNNFSKKEILIAYKNTKQYSFKIRNFFLFFIAACKKALKYAYYTAWHYQSQDKGLPKLIRTRLESINGQHGWNNLNFDNLKSLLRFTKTCIFTILEKFMWKKNICNTNAFLYDQCKKLADQNNIFYKEKFLKRRKQNGS